VPTRLRDSGDTLKRTGREEQGGGHDSEPNHAIHLSYGHSTEVPNSSTTDFVVDE